MLVLLNKNIDLSLDDLDLELLTDLVSLWIEILLFMSNTFLFCRIWLDHEVILWGKSTDNVKRFFSMSLCWSLIYIELHSNIDPRVIKLHHSPETFKRAAAGGLTWCQDKMREWSFYTDTSEFIVKLIKIIIHNSWLTSTLLLYWMHLTMYSWSRWDWENRSWTYFWNIHTTIKYIKT